MIFSSDLGVYGEGVRLENLCNDRVRMMALLHLMEPLGKCAICVLVD